MPGSLVERLAGLYILVRRFEGCKLVPYICPAGVWTCGWGSTGADVFPGKPWTQEYADGRLQVDGVKFALSALAACPALATAPDGHLSALADFAYNLGSGALRGSTLRRRYNAGDLAGARAELAKWVRGGGKVLPGLVSRRAAEATLLI